MTVPETSTLAQQRVLEEVLAWEGDRPTPPPGLAARLHEQLDTAIARSRTTDVPVRWSLHGLLRASPPGGLDRTAVRGLLLRRLTAAVIAGDRSTPADRLARQVMIELAGERPGDPSSASAWLNAAPPQDREELVGELAATTDDLRSLWPSSVADLIEIRTESVLRVRLPGAGVELVGRAGAVLDGRARDQRARALVLATHTALPRPPRDRLLARALAVLHTIATGQPPFRWGGLHVTDGRFEVEDLDLEVLGDTVMELVRLVPEGAG